MFVKLRSYNAKLGIDMLTVMPVSKASGIKKIDTKKLKKLKKLTYGKFINKIDMLTVMPVSKASGFPQNFSCPENMH